MLALVLVATSARAALDTTETEWDGSEPAPGVYFHWYEPSFYAGFAPRTQDPARVHIELARGNQVRVTVVLGDRDLDAYPDDLAARRKAYQELIDRGVITLTTNKEYERFAARLDEVGRRRASPGRRDTREEPSTCSRSSTPTASSASACRSTDVAKRWQPVLAGLDADAPLAPQARRRERGAARTRAPDGALRRPRRHARARRRGGATGRTGRRAAARSGGSLHRQGDRAGATRSATAPSRRSSSRPIYPAGTVDATTTYKGERLPDFGVTGVWNLTPRTHGRGLLGMVDYLSPNPGYGFITMLPYQYAGGITYNAFHNAGVRCQLNSPKFLPCALAERRERARRQEALPEPLDREPRRRSRTAAPASRPAT